MKKYKRLALIITDSLFCQFRDNPNYRGPNFHWDNFPNLAKKFVETSLFMYYPNMNLSQNIIDKAGAIAYNKAITLIKTLND